MTPSWYDVLGVDADASAEQIRTAWRASVADLDPTDRRFRLRNRAAEVLLDPRRRAEHDAELVADDTDGDDELDDLGGESTTVGPVAPRSRDDSAASSSAASAPTAAAASTSAASAGTTVTLSKPATASAAPRTGRTGRVGRDPVDPDDTAHRVVTPVGSSPARLAWATAVLAVLAVLLVVAASIAVVHTRDGQSATAAGASLPDDQDIVDAQSAATAAIVPVLSYDYRSLARDEASAKTYLTPAFADKYSQYFNGFVTGNAPGTKTVVSVRVLESGVVRIGPGSVDVLLFINRPTTNKSTSTTYHDVVTARMVETDGTWLVDCLLTSASGSCGV